MLPNRGQAGEAGVHVQQVVETARLYKHVTAVDAMANVMAATHRVSAANQVLKYSQILRGLV